MRSRSGRRRFSAAVLMILTVLVTAVALQEACGGGSDPVPPSPESIAAGAALFATNCSVCHGADGRGGQLAPDLAVHVPTRSPEFLFGRISNGFVDGAGVETMPGWEDALSETERWHLVNFLVDGFGDLTFVTPEG